jgi:hypothetical protein
MTAAHRRDAAITSGEPVAGRAAPIREQPAAAPLPRCCERWIAEQAHRWAAQRGQAA